MVQCAALKTDGSKCGNHASGRSKYCASHQGYRPKGRAKKVLDGLKKARAMKQIRTRAKKTGGGSGPIRNRASARKVMGGTARCAAKTSAGKACRNLPRPGSKYCTAHKGYRPKRT